MQSYLANSQVSDVPANAIRQRLNLWFAEALQTNSPKTSFTFAAHGRDSRALELTVIIDYFRGDQWNDDTGYITASRRQTANGGRRIRIGELGAEIEANGPVANQEEAQTEHVDVQQNVVRRGLAVHQIVELGVRHGAGREVQFEHEQYQEKDGHSIEHYRDLLVLVQFVQQVAAE